MQCDFRNGLALGRCISDVTLTSYKRGEFPTQITVTHVRKTKVEGQGIPRGIATAQTFVEQTVLGTEESGQHELVSGSGVSGEPACWRPQPGCLPSTFIHLASTPGTYSL